MPNKVQWAEYKRQLKSYDWVKVPGRKNQWARLICFGEYKITIIQCHYMSLRKMPWEKHIPPDYISDESYWYYRINDNWSKSHKTVYLSWSFDSREECEDQLSLFFESHIASYTGTIINA